MDEHPLNYFRDDARDRSTLAAEAAVLESDPLDRDEMRAVAEFMGALDDE
jgi:hypothetical protein